MERIMLSRKKAGMTQQQLADALGVQRAVISKYENGTIEPSVTQICKIADVLGVPVSYLLCRTDESVDMLSTSRSAVFRNRLQCAIDQADSADLQEMFGSSQPFQDVLDGEQQITLTRANEVADSIGLPLRYLLGFTDDPSDASDRQVKILLEYENFGQKVKNDLLHSKDQIMAHAPVAIRNAQAVLLEKVDEICKDSADLDEALQLHELELMPARIGLITDFLEANKSFLRKNMPGMVPQDE